MSEPSVKDLFVLGRVSQGPTYGHEINRTVEVSRADIWLDISPKHVYYVLRKLEKEGLVESEQAPGDGRSRRVYRITPAGREALAAWLADARFAGSVPYSDFDTVVALLRYTSVLTDTERTQVLERRLAELERRLADEYAPLKGSSMERRFGATARALYDKGRLVTDAERAWLEALIREVERDGWEAFRVTEVGGGRRTPSHQVLEG
jgi:DNA-binding PadR family transcriptional regulator